jgi:hypothetical protein
VKLTKVAGSCSDGDTCPGKYLSDRRTVVYVGREVTDAADRAQMGIGPGETAVEVPPEVT